MKKNKPPLIKKLITRFAERNKRLQREKTGFCFKHNANPTPPNPQGITAILTVYKRAGYLEQQVNALRAQTVPPEQIWLWGNDSGAPMPDFSDLVDKVVISNFNWKFWGRFALANLATTQYIALFDDDILPQPRWFENCLQTIAEGNNGILGGSGVLLAGEDGYRAHTKVGWNGKHNTTTETVDLVGHAWFFAKQHLSHFWCEEPYSWDNGEDIHLSYTALKYGSIKTYVPPHPTDKPDLWSCDPQFGKIAGGGSAATYKTANHKPIRDAAVRHYCQNGWQIVSKTE